MEDPDDPRTHQGENRGSSPVVLDVVYASPRGAALSADQPDPGCGLTPTG